MMCAGVRVLPAVQRTSTESVEEFTSDDVCWCEGVAGSREDRYGVCRGVHWPRAASHRLVTARRRDVFHVGRQDGLDQAASHSHHQTNRSPPPHTFTSCHCITSCHCLHLPPAVYDPLIFNTSVLRCVFQELPEPNRACLVGVW